MPAFFPLLHQLGDEGGICRVVGDVRIFLRVGLLIVEFDGIDFRVILGIDPDGETVAVGAHRIAHQFIARVLTECGGLPWALGFVKQGLEASTFQMGWQFQTSQIGERWIDIHKLHQRVGGNPGSFHAWRGKDQRRVGVVLGIAVLRPTAVFA